MAMSGEAQHEGSTWSSIVTEGSIPDSLRVKGVDEATRLTYLTKKWTPFTWWLHKNFKSTKKIVKDRMYKSWEVSEFDRFYTVQTGSGVGTDANTERVISLTNKQAAEVKVNDILFIKGLFATPITRALIAGQVIAASAGVQGTNVGPDLGWSTGADVTDVRFSRAKGPNADGYYYVDLEQVKVASVGNKNSGGTGLTSITLDRCYMGPSESDEGGRLIPPSIVYSNSTGNVGIYYNIVTGNQAARIVQNDVLLRAAPSFNEGSNYPTGVYKNPISDINFTQLFKYAVEKTKESDIPAMFIKERPMDINRWATMLRMNRDREFANLCGRKAFNRDTDGREEYLMGGVRPFIPKDADHYFQYPSGTLTWRDLQDFSIPFYSLCNSGEMWGVCGVTLMTKLVKSFWNTNMWYNKEESQDFQMRVRTLMIGEVTVNLIVSQIFEEAGFGNELMLLDMSQGDSFEPVTNEGWDMIVDKDIAERGANVDKEGIQGMFGLRRRRKEHHAIMDFSNAI